MYYQYKFTAYRLYLVRLRNSQFIDGHKPTTSIVLLYRYWNYSVIIYGTPTMALNPNRIIQHWAWPTALFNQSIKTIRLRIDKFSCLNWPTITPARVIFRRSLMASIMLSLYYKNPSNWVEYEFQFGCA